MYWGLKCKGDLGSDKGLCPLGLRDEGSFVTVKLDPPPFLGGVPLSRYTSFLSVNFKYTCCCGVLLVRCLQDTAVYPVMFHQFSMLSLKVVNRDYLPVM